jgi:hypothetical protein
VCFVLRTDHDVVSRGDSYTDDTWRMRWAAGVCGISMVRDLQPFLCARGGGRMGCDAPRLGHG